MHELSIASSIVKTVLEEVKNRNLKTVTLVSMRIGALTDVVPDSLQFGFEAITKDTILAKTDLHIETISVKGCCNNCQHNFEVFEFVFICPNCESNDIKMSHGNELEIAYIEAED